MAKTKILWGEEARQKLLAGMEAIYKSVAPTLGSHGRNAALTRWQRPLIINDGVTIARKIVLEDMGENMGADFIKEVAERTNEEAGDGTSTSIILAYTLVSYGFELLQKKPEISPLKLRKELEVALELALKKLDARAIPIKDDAELIKIAKISSDDQITAELVTSAFKQAGDTGKVYVQETQGLKTKIEKIPGMEIEGGFISPYFVNRPDKSECVLENPYVLVTDKTFVSQDDILPLLEEIKRSGSLNAVIVCKDAQAEALACMVGNMVKGKMNVLAVKAPRDKETLKDLANFCGKQEAWTDENSMSKAKAHNCSLIQKIIATREKTTFVKGDRSDTEQSIYNVRTDALKGMIIESTGEEKINAEDRLARITGSVVLISVGAASSTEIVYERLKIEDAVNALKSAMKEGYVTGGGLTLRDITIEVANELKETDGSLILGRAAQMPLLVLLNNAGIENPDLEKINATDGFNTNTGHYEKNLMEKGIIDPVLVEKRALTNAVSLAGLILTTETLIIDIPEPRLVQP